MLFSCAMSATVRAALLSTSRRRIIVRLFSRQGVQDRDVQCWKCERMLKNVHENTEEQFFCDCSEKVVLPTSGKDHFEILGCSRAFHLEEAQLKRTLLRLQALLHPDKFTQKSKEEQRNSAEQSAVVNKAFSTLAKPYPRALYLLALEGVSLRSSHGGEMDHTFLMEVMEANEKVEHTSDTQVLLHMKEQYLSVVAEMEGRIAATFKAQDFDTASEILAQMKYYQTILDSIDDKLHKH